MATSDKKLIQITARVIDRKTKQGLSNLRVEAWDKDLIVKTAIGAATTDQQGAFIIETSKSQLNDLFANRHCVLFFKVFRAAQLIISTEASVLWDRDAPDSEIVIKATTDTPPPVDGGKTFTVSGQVRQADGSVFKDGFVQAFITLQAQEKMLGEAKPGPNGQFEIAYTLDASQLSQLANARVVVRVFDSQKVKLAESPSFIPDTTVTVNITIPNPPPKVTLSVQGQVRTNDRTPISKTIVRAFITSSEKETPLGETQTDSSGNYKITAEVESSLLTQPTNARLEARAFDKNETRLASSSSALQKDTKMDIVVSTTPPDKIFMIHGRVLRSDKPLAGVTVQIFGVSPPPEARLGDPAVTNNDGGYEIQYKPGTFDGEQNQESRVQVRVSDDQRRELFKTPFFRSEAETLLDLKVEDHVVPPQPFIVRGLVTNKGGGGFDGIVRVFSIATGKQLGNDATTSDSGQYEISYQAGKLSGTADAGELVIVRVFDKSGRERAHSDQFNAVPLKVIDLVVDPLPDDGQTFVVQGRVIQPGNIAFVGGIVRVFSISTRQQLGGDASTDNAGQYKISYKAGKLSGTVDTGELVIVRVFDQKEKLLVASNPFNAQPVKVVDLVVTPSDEEITFIVRGQVLKSDGAFFVGGAVRASHEGAAGQTPLGEGVTDGEGRYSISYPSRKVTGPVNLRVQVYDGNGKLLAQSDLISGAKPEEIVNLTIPIAEPVNVVKGRVAQVDGKPIVKAMVLAEDRDVRSEQLLGRAVTDNDGRYEISYTSAQFARAEKNSADLVVSAYQDEKAIAANQPMASSAIIFNAQAVETVDLVVGDAVLRGPSEYEQIEAELEPLLEAVPPAPNVQVETLTDEEIAFLAGETGLDLQHISFFAAAAKLRTETGLAAEIFYGFAREKLPTTLNLLLAQSTDTQRRALEAAISENIIPASVGSTIDSVLDSLKKLIAQQAFAKPSEPGKTSLGALIGTALANTAQQMEIVTRYVNHTGTIEEFWDGLRADPVYSASVDDLQFSLQLGSLTANHLPLVSALRQMRTKKGFQSVRDLVRLGVEDWKSLVTGESGASGTGFPPEVPGADDAEKATNYATILTRMLRDAFPTAAVAQAVSLDNIPGKSDLTTFFTNNVAFDLGTTHIDTYLADNARTALAHVSDPAALTQQLKSFQRVHRLAPEYEQMRDLLGENLHSAQAISRIGETAFVNRFGPTWGTNQAQLVFANAVQTATTALMLLGEHGAAFNSLGVAVLGTNGQTASGIPNLESLFGSLDLCDCEQCRTVLSPAAYLVDILAFLKHRASTIASKSAKDILFQRRPDLGQVELTCENTNTPLPYVDLVNELLEDCVAPPSVLVAQQTTGTVDELMANPQYLNQAAYTKLQSEVFPWSLPFHLASEEVHAYLDHLGVPRHELMRTFQKPGTPPDPTDTAIAADYLGLGTLERQIITGTLTPLRQPWEFWGYATASPGAWLTDVRNVRFFLDKSGLTYADLVDLLEAKFINPHPADPNLGIVILSTDPLDTGTCDTEKLRIANAPNNLSPAEFQSFLDRVHRFVRLWRKLGWTSRELDMAISALQGAIPNINQRLTEAFVLRLSHIQRLRGDFKLNVEQLLALWAPIDIDGEDSLYQRLFQNPAVLKPVDENFQLSGAELKIVTTAPSDANISKHTATILAALGLSAADLAALTAITATGVTVTDDRLNLANLSKLYRVSLLAKGMKLSIQDTLLLRELAEVDPFDAADTGNALRFSELAAQVRASGFSLAELDYLLRHSSSSFSAIPPAEASIAQALDEIRQGLQKINDETTLTPDPAGDITRKKLALLKWNSAIIEEVIATLNDEVVYEAQLASLPAGLVVPTPLLSKASYDTASHMLRFKGAMSLPDKASLLGLSNASDYQTAVQSLFDAPRNFVSTQMRAFEIPTFSAPLAVLPAIVFPDEFRGKLFYDASAQQLRFVGFMVTRELTALQNLSIDPGYQSAINALSAAPATFPLAPDNMFLTPQDASTFFNTPVLVAERFQTVLGKLVSHLRAQSQKNLVKQKLGDVLRLDSNIIEQLLTRRINSPANLTKKSLNDFLAPAFAESDLQVKLTATGFPDQFQTFTLLHKVAMVLTKFKVTVNELTWLFDYGPGVGWLDLNALTASSASPGLFAGWTRLADVFQFRDEFPLGEAVLSEVFSAARETVPDHAALLARLSAGASWNLLDLKFLDGITGFNLSFPSAYHDESALLRLRDCFVLMKRLGASAEKCFALAKADLTPDDAASVKQTAKAKYDDEQWLAIAKPLRDVVREKQRASLVAYLVAHPDPARGQTWKDINGLFEYFLIDVEMSPCQLTSRIKQAIGAVQLFVQRCLMNLEPSVLANAQTDIHWREWKWMKNYRVWEANRKIFLYPENWIEPDLRDGKSPFFKDLESDLLQNEITQETAESALLTYVEKLDAVAHLETVGMYDQQEMDAQGNRVVDILHVFGRTLSSPHLYHYRQRVDSAYWTPWEKVDLDIEGNHLIPVVWNRRLCLFWPIFTEKSRPDPKPGAVGHSDTIKFWEIQIAWSEFKNKKWTAKRISKAIAEAPNLLNQNLPKDQFVFKGLITNGDLAIRIYSYFFLAGEGKGDAPSPPPLRPFTEFSFAGCNSEPVVVPLSVLTNVTPLVVPLRTIPTNMQFVEAWLNPTFGRG